MRTAFLLAAVCTTLSLSAQNWQFDVGPEVDEWGLNGANERPFTSLSPATGKEDTEVGGIFYDPDANQLHINIGWGSAPAIGGTDLTSPVTEAHIHGPADVNGSADVVYPLSMLDISPGGADTRSGFLNSIITLQDIGAYTVAQQEADLLGNLWYINIHTATFPDGEIRGQLLNVIPEPQHYAAFAGLALLGFAGYRRYKTGTALR